MWTKGQKPHDNTNTQYARMHADAITHPYLVHGSRVASTDAKAAQTSWSDAAHCLFSKAVMSQRTRSFASRAELLKQIDHSDGADHFCDFELRELRIRESDMRGERGVFALAPLCEPSAVEPSAAALSEASAVASGLASVFLAAARRAARRRKASGL